jgi:hypothetical protein
MLKLVVQLGERCGTRFERLVVDHAQSREQSVSIGDCVVRRDR